jgi:hypothetical protein
LAGAGNWPFWNLAGAGAVNFINPWPSQNFSERIRWNIVIVKTIRDYKNKGPLLNVGTPDIILSKLKIDFQFWLKVLGRL